MALFVLGGRDPLEDQLAQRLEVAAFDIGVERRPAGTRVRVDDRELDLVLVGTEVDEQLVHLVDHLRDARVGTVDLVHDENHREVRLERLAQDEAGLRERAFARVDEEEHSVDHGERTLDLAAEVGVTGGVDDVQRHVAVLHRRVLGEDRDALLAFQVVRVHDPLVDVLVGAKRAGLPQERVDEGGLAVVDVGDDRHVAQVVARAHTELQFGGSSSVGVVGADSGHRNPPPGPIIRRLAEGRTGRARGGVRPHRSRCARGPARDRRS